MKLYLHIGIPRTASTFLQAALFSKLGHVHYLGPNSKAAVAIGKLIYEKRSLNFQDYDLLNDLAKSSQDILISSETLSFEPWLQEYPSHQSRLKEIFDEVQIILFLRHPTDWVFSLYGLAIQKGRFIPIREFVDFDGKFSRPQTSVNDRKTRVNIQNFSPHRVLTDWNQVFDHTKLFFFETFLANQETLLSEMLAAFDWNANLKKVSLAGRNNASPTLATQDTAVGVFKTFVRHESENRFFRSLQHRLGRFAADFTLNQNISSSLYSQQEGRLAVEAALNDCFSSDIDEIKKRIPGCPWR